MFTLQDIKTAHSKVKSGADFPKYIQELKLLGVVSYENHVSDGHTQYHGQEGFNITSEAKYASLSIANTSAIETLKHSLVIHQQGQTDYITFCKQAAEAGVNKWVVDLEELTCTYYNVAGENMVEEQIPS